MITISDEEFAVKLCKILGLDSSKTMTISIKVQPDDIIKIITEQVMYVDEGHNILKLMEYYHLVKNDGTNTDETKQNPDSNSDE